MPLGDPGSGLDPTPVVFIPEVRDYQRINAELVGLLDAGHKRVRLEGAEGQRLIASGLVGDWDAVVEISGRTGPELGSGLDAPGLSIVARGSTADGLASSMRSGLLVVGGDAGDSAGYCLAGGTVVITRSAGHRLGLRQSGGCLAVMGAVGRLAGDRQAGGLLMISSGEVGPHAGRGRIAGRMVLANLDEWSEPDLKAASSEINKALGLLIGPIVLPEH